MDSSTSHAPWLPTLLALALGGFGCSGAPTEAQPRESGGADDPPHTPTLVYPVITGVGGAAELPEAAYRPDQGGPYRVVFDVTAAPDDGGGANPGLAKVARFLNIYGSHGVPAEDMELVVVLHGKATAASLADEAHRAHGGGANPNTELLAQLKRAGVELTVCGQALAHNGYEPAEVAEGVAVAVAALTVVPMLANEGYHVQPL